jgi:hypothetical protein
LRLESDYDVSGLLADVSPPVSQFADERLDADWTLRLLADDSVRPEARQRRTWYLTDGIGDRMMSWASVRQWDDHGVELLYHDDVAGMTCTVTSDFHDRCTIVAGPPTPLNRRPLRLIRLFFGHRLLEAGWTPLHAASLVLDGAGVICCGAPGAGKSTIAFLATALGRATFLADDVSLVGRARTPRVIGWPTRVGVTERLVAATMPGKREELTGLRHPTLPPPAFDDESPARVLRGPRFSFDRSEHRSILGTVHGGPCELRLVVLLETDPSVATPVLHDISPDVVARALPRYLATSEEARFLVDVLGLVGMRRVPRWDVPRGLLALRAVKLRWGTDPTTQGDAVDMLAARLEKAGRPGS